MSQASTHGNGCSLEDCHTNLFALTDLDGIKWRRFSAETVHSDPLEDPVLQSYTQCLQADILSVWRRVHRNSEQRTTEGLTCQKELWIFWYGDEPPNLSVLLSNDLREEEKGSWDNGGLSYECRTLLFKALHNLIERCLLSQNFVRLGMWFVQPHDYGPSTTLTDRSTHLSIKFSFFLHGESQVCASIDVRQHMPMRRLQPYHLALVSQGAAHGIHVILAPYGLQGTITGQAYKETDHATQKLMDDWRQFYNFKDADRNDGLGMPPAVEVIVAGVRMRYPTQFVLVTAETEASLIASPAAHRNPGCLAMGAGVGMSAIGPGGVPLTPPQSPGNALSEGGIKIPPMPPDLAELEPPIGVHQGRVLSGRVMEKVSQDSCLTLPPPAQRPGGGDTTLSDDGSSVGVWDFSEPMQRTNCNCTKAKAKQRASSGAKGSALGAPSKHPKDTKSDKPGSRHSRTLSFHRRGSMLADELLQHDIELVAQRMPAGFATFKTPGMTPGGSIPNLGHNRSFGDVSVDSPHSAAPSPLVATPGAPAVNHNADPTMPTLSPHPPIKREEKETASTPGAQIDLQLEPQTNGPDGFTDNNNAKDPNVVNSVITTKPEPGEVTLVEGVTVTATIPTEVKAEVSIVEAKLSLEARGLKRPMLPTKDYEDENNFANLAAIYDFKPLQAWFDHPWKRHRWEGRKDLMSARSMYTSSPLTLNGSAFAKSRDSSPPSPSQPSHDPYEFSDESSNAGNFGRALRNREDSVSRSNSLSKNEDDSRRNSDSSFTFKDEQKSSLDLSPHTPGQAAVSLMREKDLIPTVKDLDNIFESDSDSGEAEPFQVSTPPGSNKPCEEIKAEVKTEVVRSGGGVPDILGDYRPTPKELSRMFPTPPSMDNQHNQLSPCMGTEPMNETPTAIMELAVPRTDIPSLARSAEESTIKDWSYVFKPAVMAPFLHSKRYAPIELPSSKEPPLPVPLQYRPSQPYSALRHPERPPPPPASQYTNLPSVESVPRSVSERGMTSIEESPAPSFPHSNQQRTPMSYELPSPMSNASSYLNKNLNSVDNHGTNSPLPEAHSLVTVIMLSDSSLNLFKDHNFDSCTICVCNMNIKGVDIGVYLPDKNAEPQYKCTCGFSAVTNRRLGKNAGLFYEDEVDITGIRDDRYDRIKKPSFLEIEPAKDGATQEDSSSQPEDVPQDILCLLQTQFSTFFPSEAVVQCYNYRQRLPIPEQPPNFLLDIQDGCEACYSALEAGRQAVDNCVSSKLEDAMLKSTCLHKWPFVQASAKIPANSQDIVALLQALQPLLQDTIQKKRTTSFWESVYTVSGPLTWKDFHLLAGRGQDEACEPQPIPPLLLGHEKDWLSLSPHALQFWDKLLLEPYGRMRDVAYIVVAPENDYMLQQVRFFFKELSTVYETCRFGRHVPIDKVLRDGIMRVGKSAASKVSDQEVHEWFNLIAPTPLAAKLKLYAQVCRHRLAPYLSTHPLDKSMFEVPKSMANGPVNSGNHQRPTPKPSPTPSPAPPGSNEPANPGSNSQPQNHIDDKGDGDSQSQKDSDATLESDSASSDGDLPGLVIYMVDPFSFAQDWEDFNRLAMLGLLRCFHDMLRSLPEHLASNIQLQVVPLQSILTYGEQPNVQHLKALAMATYSQCRRNLSHTILGRSLTGFGPAASAELVLKNSDAVPGRMLTSRAFCPPFILAPQKDAQTQFPDQWGDRTEKSGNLFVSYCLSEDQHWLLATCTDKQGEILETCVINIDIPNRNRRKKASARKIGLSKLWDFILGVLSTTARPWRLVIGRFGRIGHGELQGWAGLLSRKNLIRASKQLKDMCGLCGFGAAEMPCILSACLVSLDVHPSVHVMPNSIKVEEKKSSNCQLSTPEDASATHILVFPTSATAQANTGPVHQDNHMDLTDNFGDAGLDGEGDLLSNLMQDGELGDLHDLFTGGLTSPVGSPKNHSPMGSPNHGAGGRHSPTMNGPGEASGPTSMGTDAQEEPGNLLMQPLAMGFYVSSAPTGPMPKWFWSSCPHREGLCPTCFKAALHIHCPTVQQNQDEFMPSTQGHHCHPLDSNFTCDVLRYVLETYNALSWLSMDPVSGDRRSCLPIHIVVLMQLYHALQAFV